MAYYRNSYFTNSQQNGVHDANVKYKKKYGRLKNKIKRLVFENGAMCDEIAQVQETTLLVKDERKYLMRRLLEYEDIVCPPPSNSASSPSTSSARAKRKSSDSSSKYTLPFYLGNLTIHSLGNVVTDRPLYHAEDMIYPVGFVSTRVYGSLRNPLKKCVYTCKIIDAGNEPRFEIIAGTDFDSPIVGSTPDYCHSILLQYINDAATMVNFSIYPKGGQFFGLTHPAVLHMIQSLPGARKCLNFKWNRYEVMKSGDCDNDENDSAISYNELQKCIIMPYHSMGDIKEEPPDDMLDFADS